MKKTIFILALMGWMVSSIMAQSQRKVFLEHFTQASCGPCATYNPGVQAIISANPDKIVYIKYQTSWPGYDPMNLHNPTDVASRVGLYGVSGVPSSVLDGNYYNGHPSGWNIGTVNARYAISTPIEIQMEHHVNTNQDSVFVTMLVKATGPVNGLMAAYIGVVEKHIHFTSPPGSNGETDFYHVMKKLLPNTAGAILPSSMNNGDYVIFQYSWELANFYDLGELGVVGWVQNKNTSEVFQSENSSTNPITPLHSKDAAMRDILGIGTTWCGETVSPSVVLRNQGSQVLTAADIHYKVNGGQEEIYSWSGSLGFLEETIVDLPTGSLVLDNSNVLEVYIETVNGGADEYSRNDTIKRHFSRAPGTSENVYLFLRTDDFPEQTTWEVLNDQGVVQYSGGPYTQAGDIIQETFTLTPGCYSFQLKDAGGDGICCTNGFGVYQLTSDISGQVLGEGDKFQREVIHSFMVGGYAGIDEPLFASEPGIFPNPASNVAYLEYELLKPESLNLQILDVRGKIVYEGNYESTAGRHRTPIKTDLFDPGFYLLKLNFSGKQKVLKMSVLR